MSSGRGHDVGLAVDRAAGGRVHEPPRAAAARRLEHVDRADHVDLGVERRAARSTRARRSAPRGGRRPRASRSRAATRPGRASRMSSTTSFAPRASAGSMFALRPVERLSSTTTSSPRSSSASTRLEPMKPAPPVTRTFTTCPPPECLEMPICAVMLRKFVLSCRQRLLLPSPDVSASEPRFLKRLQ